MTTKTELKPCPFCGEKPTMYLYAGDWFVKCINDDCSASPCTHSQNKAEAIKAWNTRPDTDAIREAVEVLEDLGTYLMYQSCGCGLRYGEKVRDLAAKLTTKEG